MPRTYHRTPGSRRYADYSLDVLNEAVERHKAGMSLRQCALRFGVPKSIIANANKFGQRHYGGQTALGEELENKLVEFIITMSEWGYPVDHVDIRYFVKNYLGRSGKSCHVFSNNMPGTDWATSFTKRHGEMTIRYANNIKRSRAEVSSETIADFSKNLKKTIGEDPDPSKIWNFDKTNLSDDPGKKKVICKRGTKYVDNIINTSKASTSIMFCGSANGFLLPSYVCYKAQNLYSSWIRYGPSKGCGGTMCNDRCCRDGSRFNRSKSGWFDSLVFEDWFRSCFIKHVKCHPEHELHGDTSIEDSSSRVDEDRNDDSPIPSVL